MDNDDDKKTGADDEEGTDEEQDLDEDLDDDLDLLDEDEEGEEEEDPDEEDGEEDDEEDEEDEDFSEKDLEDPAKRAKAVELLKKSKSAIKQRAIWKQRALKLGHGKKKTPPAPPQKKKAAAPKSDEALEEARALNELTNFRLDHPDIPGRMVREINRYARANEMTMEKALRRPLIQRFVNDKKLKERLSKASAGSRHRSPQTPPPKDWSKATPEEVKAHEREVRSRSAGR